MKIESVRVAHNPRLVALIERDLSKSGGRSLEQVEREVSRRERKLRRRS